MIMIYQLFCQNTRNPVLAEFGWQFGRYLRL